MESQISRLLNVVCEDLHACKLEEAHKSEPLERGEKLSEVECKLERDVRDLRAFCALHDRALSPEQRALLENTIGECVDVVKCGQLGALLRPLWCAMREEGKQSEQPDATQDPSTEEEEERARANAAYASEDTKRARLLSVADAPPEWMADSAPMPPKETLEADIRRAIRLVFENDATGGVVRISLDHKAICDDMRPRPGVNRSSVVCSWDDVEWRLVHEAARERLLTSAILADKKGDFMFELPARLYPSNARYRACVIYHGIFVGAAASARGVEADHDPRTDVLPLFVSGLLPSRPHKLIFAEIARTEAPCSFGDVGGCSEKMRLKKGFLLGKQ